MTQPKRAIATDQGRYYTHPVTGELLISVTNVLSEAMAKPAPVPWAAKASNDAAWSALPRMVAAILRPLDCKPTSRELSQMRAEGDDWTPCGRCMPCLTREIKGAHKLIAERASDLGTRIHAHADAHITGASLPLCSVRLNRAIPKKDIFRVMEEIDKVQLTAPVRIGQIAIENVCGLGADVIVTKNMDLVG